MIVLTKSDEQNIVFIQHQAARMILGHMKRSRDKGVPSIKKNSEKAVPLRKTNINTEK